MIQSRLGFKWDARGDDARIADTSNQMELTITVGPGHLKLSHAKRKGLFILRFMTFDGFGRQLPDERKELAEVTLQTMFDLDRPESSTDVQFSQTHSIDFGIPGVFMRNGNQLIVLRDMDLNHPNFSVFLYPAIKRGVSDFIIQANLSAGM